MKLGEIIAALPSLTAKDRKALKAALDSFIYADTMGVEGLDLELLGAVQAITGQYVNLVSFKGTQAYKVWMTNQPVFNELFDTLTGGKNLTKTVKIAAKKFLIGLLIEYLKETHKPVTLPTIATELANIKRIINDNFPGYLDNKLGGIIMNRLKGID